MLGKATPVTNSKNMIPKQISNLAWPTHMVHYTKALMCQLYDPRPAQPQPSYGAAGPATRMP